MATDKKLMNDIDITAKVKKKNLTNNLSSSMFFKSDISSSSISFEWLDIVEEAVPLIDNVIRIPKVALIKEEITVNAEKSKKVTVESIKDLTKHPNYVGKMDKKTNEVEPEKILNVINEETYNIYENRFLYTLVNDLETFVYAKEKELKNFILKEYKELEYNATSDTSFETVELKLLLTSKSKPKGKIDKKLKDQIEDAKSRIKNINDYVSSWHVSPMFKELDKAHINFLKAPIKKTNILLKNPNFKAAMSLFEYLQKSLNDQDKIQNYLKKNFDPLQGFLDHSFMIDFYVMDSISKTKKERKEKMSRYGVLMLKDEINRVVSLLTASGIKITDEQIIELVKNEIDLDKKTPRDGKKVIEDKFRNAMDEYLKKIEGNL